jgi:RNA polymerase sigma factor (sigma-70 family)
MNPMLENRLSSPPPLVTTESHSSDAYQAAAAAADELYVQHAPLLRHIAVQKFRVPTGDADALVHDVFTTYFGRPSTVHSPRPYLIGAICNAARHYWRERKTEEKALVSADAWLAPPHETILDTIGRKLLIAATLARLSDGCRDLLRRYYLNGETTVSIAAARETTPDYILFLLHKCRKRAREIARELTVL